MSEAAADIAVHLARLMRADRGRLTGALARELGDFALAEDALSEAAASALVHWARSGLPASPGAWIYKVARRKAIDALRRDARFAARAGDIARLVEVDAEDRAEQLPEDIPDTRLRLIFTCCHPALEEKTRVALTLRTVCGLSTEEVARAFLDAPATMGQRLSRARAKISRAGIPFTVPAPDLWDDRLGAVLAVIYLVYNEGYSALDRPDRGGHADLCAEAIYLARMLCDLRPDEPEIDGLLALLLLGHARAGARIDGGGATCPLDEQDPAFWDGAMADEGLARIEAALLGGRPGPYQIQAAISACHVEGRRGGATDWAQIVMLYEALYRMAPSPVVALNRAAALARSDPVAALAVIEAMGGAGGEMQGYQPFHAAHADVLARLDRRAEARAAYGRAIALCHNGPDRIFLEARQERLD